jgi:hypothetical protein
MVKQVASTKTLQILLPALWLLPGVVLVLVRLHNMGCCLVTAPEQSALQRQAQTGNV